MAQFELRENILNSVVGGLSALDIPTLNVQSLDEASSFVKSYGYDLANEEDLNRLWLMHRKSIISIKENLLDEGEEVPSEIADPSLLRDLRNLLIYASNRKLESREIQKWSCAVLRVMHVFVHLENDLFSRYSDQIQEQVLRPIQRCIISDKASGSTHFSGELCQKKVRLNKFDIKPYKTTHSSIIKLLAKPGMVALNLLDKLGVRFVTKTRLDAFRVVEILVRENLISFPHIMPDQSSNTLFPTSLFLDVVHEGEVKGWSDEKIEEKLLEQVELRDEGQGLRRKHNDFSASDFRFIKFINRRRVVIPKEDEPDLCFFYPFEVQIMDYDTYMNNLSGPTAHDVYKERQRQAARRRVLGLKEV